MAQERVERRLAAILAADVVGYSRLVGKDEEGTIARLKALREELIDPSFASHRGRIVKTTGDGILVEFSSVVDAVRCAVEVQKAMAERNADVPEDRRITFRVGVNLGDIVIDGDDILGDGVNVAARLEGLAEPGGICIPRKVFHEVRNKLDVGYEFIGEQKVKNIETPIPAYRVLLEPEAAGQVIGEKRPSQPLWRWGAIAATGLAVVVVAVASVWWQPWVERVEPASVERMAFPLPEKPSIAVLPFTNMSGDPEQEYFADGMTEDIITDLSKISGLFVIARHSSFAYKGKSPDLRAVGRELGVRYLLEGSVRRAGNQVRVNAQLIDATTGGHLWAERYDGSLDDIFALQDKIAAKIIGQLAVRLKPEEAAVQAKKKTVNAAAHDAFLQGWALYMRATPEHLANAVPFFEEALRRDPDYGRSYAALAAIYNDARNEGFQDRFGLTPDDALEKALEYLEKTKRRPTPLAHQVASAIYSTAGRHADAIAEAQQAIALNPNNPAGYFARAKALIFAGRAAEGAEAIAKGMRLNPHFPPDYLFYLGVSQFGMEKFGDAAVSLEQVKTRVPSHRGTLTFLIASYGFLNRTADAKSAIDRLKQLAINASVDWRLAVTVLDANIWRFKDPADLERLREGLRRGGMPEFKDEWGLNRADKLSGGEIRKLAFGRTHRGRHPVSGLEFTIARTSKGKFTSGGLWSDTGVSRIVGDRLCNEWTKYSRSCAVIYRNPGGTRKALNEYLLVQRSGAFPFSPTD